MQKPPVALARPSWCPQRYCSDLTGALSDNFPTAKRLRQYSQELLPDANIVHSFSFSAKLPLQLIAYKLDACCYGDLESVDSQGRAIPSGMRVSAETTYLSARSRPHLAMNHKSDLRDRATNTLDYTNGG